MRGIIYNKNTINVPRDLAEALVAAKHTRDGCVPRVVWWTNSCIGNQRGKITVIGNSSRAKRGGVMGAEYDERDQQLLLPFVSALK